MDDFELLQESTADTVERQPAWHRLGTATPNVAVAAEALETAGLSRWNVTKRPVFTTGPGGGVIPVRRQVATVRRVPGSDGDEFDCLGVVSPDYRVIQNEEAFEFLTDLVDAGDATFETAGAMDGGARVFITMRLPGHVRVAGHDGIDLYLAVTTSHDGQSAFTAIPTPVRIECQNTLTLALKTAKTKYRLQHRRGRTLSVEQAREMLGLTVSEGADIVRAAEEMLRIPVADSRFDAVVAEVFVPVPNNVTKLQFDNIERDRRTLRYLFRNGPNQEFGRGTAWAAFNAISEWSEWFKPNNPNSAGAVNSTISGKIAGTRQKAWDLFAPVGFRSS